MPDTPTRRLGARYLPVLATLAAMLCGGAARAQAPAGQSSVGIYTCIDERGRRLTADRPIPECAGREQLLLNRDGSVKAVHPPALTAVERAESEARERRAAEARAAQTDAVRRDRNLVARYPTEAAHQRAREAALDSVRLAIKSSEMRLRELAAERRPLVNEAEFYQGRHLPPKLKAQLDANDAAVDGQRSSASTQEAELGRINRLYDAELERLRKLWAGAPAGSLGVLLQAQRALNPVASQPDVRPPAPKTPR